jgi:hypothetical protein
LIEQYLIKGVIVHFDSFGNAITNIEKSLFEQIGNGVYYTTNEFLTVVASGVVTAGWSGNLTIDRAGLIYPQQVDTERWVAFDDVTNTPIDFNPFNIEVSAPGYQSVSMVKEIREPQDLHIPLKRGGGFISIVNE